MINKKIGINGLGRMGKLNLRRLIEQGHKEIIVNTGRKVGASMADVLKYVMDNSTYGPFGATLGNGALKTSFGDDFVQIKNSKVIFLMEERNPKDIPWDKYGVQLVIDTTGKFNFPARSVDYLGGSIRGHFESSGVERVMISSPIKFDEGDEMPEDTVMLVRGINDSDYDPEKHRIISCASCSTTALASLLAPLVKYFGAKAFLNAVVTIIHAKTGKQVVLDCLPPAGKSDPCLYRSSKNNFFNSSSGSAEALPLIVHELEKTPFSVASIRVDSETVSLLKVAINLRVGDPTKESLLKSLYEGFGSKYIHWLSEPVAAMDVIGASGAVFMDGTKVNVMPIMEMANGDYLETVQLDGYFDNEGGYAFMMGEIEEMIA